MRKLIVLATMSLFGSAAFGVCMGKVKAGLGGAKMSLADASLEFISETSAIYSGPHGSIHLGDKVELQLIKDPQGWMVADLSSGGHGGETNIFYVKRAGHNVEFRYFGPYGYRAYGLLSCNRM